jgi:hypothetical protein
MKYFEKLNDIPSLPKHITSECIRIVEENLKNNVPFNICYGRYETENKSSIAYIENKEDLFGTNGEPSGVVGFYSLTHEVNESICKFYKEINHPILKQNIIYYLQVVASGNFVAAHIDDPHQRKTGLLYMLKTGGPNVRTKWHEVRDEFKHLSLENYSAIPYSKLIEVEDNHIEEDKWHWMNFNKIHSVEGVESVRIALWGNDHF